MLSWRALAQNDPIKVGVLVDLSGPLQAFGTGKARCIQLAAEEINARGGLLGRPLEIVQYDTQSQNQLYAPFAPQLALRDRVAVVHGAITSAAREVARPVLDRARVLYFYNVIYEGGLCDRNTFVTGPTPQQLLANLIPYMVERFGPRICVRARDRDRHRRAERARLLRLARNENARNVPLTPVPFSPHRRQGRYAVHRLFLSPGRIACSHRCFAVDQRRDRSLFCRPPTADVPCLSIFVSPRQPGARSCFRCLPSAVCCSYRQWTYKRGGSDERLDQEARIPRRRFLVQ